MTRFFKNLFSTKTTRTQQTRKHAFKPQIEALEQRQMLAADIVLSNGTLNITGTDFRDQIDIVESSATQIRATVKDSNGVVRMGPATSLTRSQSLNRVFNKSQVSNIIVFAQGGNDTVQNLTSIKSDLYGGNDSDILLGGSGKDRLFGENGNDTLQGKADDDLLKGGANDDTLLGGDHDDTLHGEGGKDTLFGNSGRDKLYGGTANDLLFGGTGNDGLFGGAGLDQLNGQDGADRILFHGQSPDVINFVAGEDVRIDFQDGIDANFNIAGVDTRYEGLVWSDSDIERLDAVLAVLQQHGSISLLKKSDGGELLFARYQDGRGFNNGNRIALTDDQFDGSDTWLGGYVLHEIGHHWENEHPSWAPFQALSGWTQQDKSGDANFTKSLDRAWFHRTDTDFVSDYARTNPLEDFAECFSAYFTQQAGWAWYNDGGGAAGAPAKIDHIAAWVNTL